MESTEKCGNGFKLSRLLLDGGTLALRKCLDCIVSPQSLHKELEKPEILKILKSLKSYRIISVPQWKNLFPLIQSTVTSQSFDITLLYILLTKVLRNTTGWSDLPEKRTTNITADLECIKTYRNAIYSYIRKTKMSEDEYEKTYGDLSKVLLRLGSQEIESAINDLEKDPIDCEEKEHYMEVLKKWCEQESKLPTEEGEPSVEPVHEPFAANYPEEPPKQHYVYRAGYKANDKPDFSSTYTGSEEVVIFSKKEFFNFPPSLDIVLFAATIDAFQLAESGHIRKFPTHDDGQKAGLLKFYSYVFFADKALLEELEWKRTTRVWNEGRPNVDKGYMQRALIKYARDNEKEAESPQEVNELAELKAVSHWCWPNIRMPERVQPGKHEDLRIIHAMDYSKRRWEDDLLTLREEKRKSAGKFDDSDEDVSDDSETEGLEEDIALCTLYLKEKERLGKWPKPDRWQILEKKTIKAKKKETKDDDDSKEPFVDAIKLQGENLEALNLMTKAALKLGSGDDPTSKALKEIPKCVDEPDVDLVSLIEKQQKFQKLFFEAHNPDEMKEIFQKTTKLKAVGVRVIRGSDWILEDQDGGEGGIGFVIIPDEDMFRGLECWATVHWDHGGKARYRLGLHGKCDLKIYDNSTAGVVHPSSSRSACGESPLRGMRWNCLSCSDVDLCTSCYMEDCHDTSHKFERIENPGAAGVQLGQRQNETKIQVRGMLPGAKVVSRIAETKGIFKKWIQKYPAILEIEDKNGEKAHLNLLEHNRVSLDCRRIVQGGTCYKNHLPNFRFRYKSPLKAGDRVSLDMESTDCLERIDKDKLKFAGSIGTVESIIGQDVVVNFNGTGVLMKSCELTKTKRESTEEQPVVATASKLKELSNAAGAGGATSKVSDSQEQYWDNSNCLGMQTLSNLPREKFTDYI